MTIWTTTLTTPIGMLTFAKSARGLCGIYLGDRHLGVPGRPSWREDARACADEVRALAAYFAGERREFDFARDAAGTSFQRAVWDLLCDIPFGTTISYGELATRLGRPLAARAVGAANGQNPISIVVPCHRVIGSTGALVGYAGGLAAKRWLLAHEGARVTPARRDRRATASTGAAAGV